MERSCRGDGNNCSHFQALSQLLEEERHVLGLPRSPSPPLSSWCIVGGFSADTQQQCRGGPAGEADVVAQAPFRYTKPTPVQAGFSVHLPFSCLLWLPHVLPAEKAMQTSLKDNTTMIYMYIYMYICNIHLIITSTLLNSLNPKRGREDGISVSRGFLSSLFIYLFLWNMN